MKRNCFFTCVLMLSVLYVNQGYAAKVGTFPLVLNWGTENEYVVQGGDYIVFADYVSGGVTFTYPANFFQEAPTISITLQMAGRPYMTGQICIAEVVSNSPTSTTIRINVHNGLLIREALTNDVTIHLRAVGRI